MCTMRANVCGMKGLWTEHDIKTMLHMSIKIKALLPANETESCHERSERAKKNCIEHKREKLAEWNGKRNRTRAAPVYNASSPANSSRAEWKFRNT